MPLAAHDDVIDGFDLDYLSSTDEVSGDFNVRFGGGRFSARVIVHEHNCTCGSDNRCAKDFPGMYQEGVMCAD